MVVAIDGPAGAGKSTTGRLLAERLGFSYMDTGAMYRVLTWIALYEETDLEDGHAICTASERHEWTIEGGRIEVDGLDVTDSVREPRIDRVVSRVASHPEVRGLLRQQQRWLASQGDTVIEGRDIGTVVCPDAAVKVYLIADEEERVRRRASEREGRTLDSLSVELRSRDVADAAQMDPASDATVIDTTVLEIDEVVSIILALVEAARS